MSTILTQLSLSLISFFILLLVRALFSFLETSITALRLFKLNELAQEMGQRYASLFQCLESNPHRVLSMTLIISSFADVTCAALATSIMETIFQHFHFSTGLGFSVGIGISASMIILFGEIIPKNLARLRGERLFKSSIWLINILYYTLSPLTTLLVSFSDALFRRMGTAMRSETMGSEWVSSEREVQFLIDYIHEKGILEKEKTEMLRNIFDLGRTPVKDVMVPATDTVSVEISTPIKDVLTLFSRHQFTRLPVYERIADNIVGMIHQKDIFIMLSQKKDTPLRDLVRPIFFIPEMVKINQVLREMREQHMHMAIVLNEHGSMTGLVTLEDLIEEIVGEITDEHESSSKKILSMQPGVWLADARIPVEELSKMLNTTFNTEDSVTLGGFLTEKLQHLPQKGERVLYQKHYFQIQKASQKRVKQVLIFEENRDQPSGY